MFLIISLGSGVGCACLGLEEVFTCHDFHSDVDSYIRLDLKGFPLSRHSSQVARNVVV